MDGETGTWVETTDAAFAPEVAFSNGETHILYVQERDGAGNWSTSGSFTVSIDTTAPNPPDVTGSTPTQDTTPTWTWTSGGEGNDTYRYQLDSETGTWTETPAASFTPETLFGDGETHQLYVQERDDAGNWSGSGSFTVTIDITSPNPPDVSGQVFTNDTTPTWTWTAGSGGNGTFRYQLDGEAGTWIETTDAAFTPEVAFGDDETHILYVQERDDAGNWSASGSFTSMIDTSAPNAPVVTGQAVTNDTTPTWSWSSGGGGNGTFRYQLDGETGTWMETIDAAFTPATPFGDKEIHILYVQERDDTENWSISGSFTIRIDTAAPNPPDVTGLTPTQDTTPTWSWTSGGDGNGTFRYQLDSEVGTWIETVKPGFTAETAFGDGEAHILYVQERDEVGNWSASGSYTIAIDVASPEPPTVAGDLFTADTTPAWSWSPGGGGNGSYRYQLNSETGTWIETGDTTFTYEIELGDGEIHTMFIQERDDAGNWSDSGSFATQIDTAGPYIETSTPNADATGVEPDVLVVVQLSDGGVGIDSSAISFSITGSTPVAGSLIVDDGNPNQVVISFDPDLPLQANQTYTIEINGSDILLNPIDDAENTFSFAVRDNKTVVVNAESGIQSALDSATSGDTVSVAAGTYQENLILSDGHSGIILAGAGANICNLVGLSAGMPAIEVKSGAANVTISDFSITGAGTGIVLEATGSTVENNIIHSLSSGAGIVLETAGSIVQNNIIRDLSSGAGIVVSAEGDNLLQNNVIYRSSEAGVHVTVESADTGLILMYNTIAQNDIGVRITGASSLIQYNIIASNSTYGISVTDASPIMEYNNVWDNGEDADEDGVGDDDYVGTESGDNDIAVDSRFVDRENHDYQLQSDSPCIDAIPVAIAEATPVSPVFDLTGSLRPLPSGQDYDMGAYEYDPNAEELAIISTPPETANEDEVYTYQLESTGAGIHYGFDEVSEHPTGMTINGTSGLITYTPETDAEAREYTIVVSATDRFNRSETQTYSLTVTATNDAPYFVIAPPIEGTRDAMAMPGQAYLFVVEALDEESPGSALLEYTLTGSSPSEMSLMTFDDADGYTKAQVSWGPTIDDVDTIVTVEVMVSDDDRSDTLSWEIMVLEPLIIAPNAKVLLRVVENDVPTDFETIFDITGGPSDGTEYGIELLDASVDPPVTIDSDTIGIADGKGRFTLDTAILTSKAPADTILRQLKVIDGAGFSVVSGLIEIRNVIVTEIEAQEIDGETGGQVDVSSDETEYTGASITIPPAGSGDGGFTMVFSVVDEASEPIPDTQKANLGQVIELRIEVPEGEQAPAFDGLIEVTLPFATLGIDSARVADLRVYTFDEDLGQWVTIDDYDIDTGNETITFRVSHFSLFTVGLPEIFDHMMTGGIDPKDFRMISFPGEPDDRDLLANLEATLDAYDDTQWRCAAYNATTGDYDEIDAADFAGKHPLKPGKAYWLISRDDKQIRTKGLKLSTSVFFELTLHPGWNMIANPFDLAIRHDENVYVQVSADGLIFKDITATDNLLTEKVYYRFDPHSGTGTSDTEWYTAVSFADTSESLMPYEGYWLKNTHPADLTLRFRPKTTPITSLDQIQLSSVKRKIMWFAERSVQKMMGIVTRSSFADEQRDSPPPPPASMGGNSDAIGNLNADGVGVGGCFVDIMTHRGSLVLTGWVLLSSIILVVGFYGVFRHMRQVREKQTIE